MFGWVRNGDGTVDIALDFAALLPGTVELEWNLVVGTYDYLSTTPAELQLVHWTDPIKIVSDDGLGQLKDSQGTVFGIQAFGAQQVDKVLVGKEFLQALHHQEQPLVGVLGFKDHLALALPGLLPSEPRLG